MLHLLCNQGPLGTICLQQDSDHVCLWPSYNVHHDTTKHGYSGVVKVSTGEWNGTVISVGSVCIQVMDINMYGIDLVSIIFRIHSPTIHRSHLRIRGVWGHQLQLVVTFGGSAG